MLIQKSNLLKILILILAISAGVILRSTELLNHNYVFGFDQGREYLVVREMVLNHKLRLIGSEIGSGSAGFTGIFHGPVFYYFLSLAYIFFNGDPYGGIVLMFIFGLATIIFTFFLVGKLFGYLFGLFAAILVSISPPLISQSRFLWSPNPVSFFILLAFYFTYYINRGAKYIFFSSFFSGFIYNFELATAVPVSLGLALYCLFVLRFKKLKQYLYLIAGYVFSFSPMIIFDIKHNFQASRGLFNHFSNPKNNLIDIHKILNSSKDIISSFTYSYSDTFPKQSLLPGWLIILFIFIVVVFMIYKESNKQLKYFILYLLILPLITFFVYLFFRIPVYVYYLAHLNLSIMLLFSYGFFSSYKKRKFYFSLLFLLIGIISILQFIPFSINTFIKDYFDYGGDAKIKGRVDAIDYIYKDSKGEKFGLLVFSPPVYTYPYDYIVLWYGKNRYGYIPHKEKKGLFYLLMEKDPGKPWSYNGWLETVIKDGTIEKTEVLPSGLIVQKRIMH